MPDNPAEPDKEHSAGPEPSVSPAEPPQTLLIDQVMIGCFVLVFGLAALSAVTGLAMFVLPHLVVLLLPIAVMTIIGAIFAVTRFGKTPSPPP